MPEPSICQSWREVLSPLAKGLFHKAISESGTAALEPDRGNVSKTVCSHCLQKIAAVSGCEKSSSAAMVECLRGKTEEEILQITQKMEDIFFISTCVDGVFFPKSPRELLSEKSINAVPYIVGVNNCEFGWGLPMSTIALVIKVRDHSQTSTFLSPLDAGNPVFFYEFQHRPSSVEGLVPEFVKADHGAEIAFVFGKPFLLGSAAGFLKCSEPEQSDSNGLANGELTFPSVISRNPNGEGLVHWPQYDLEEKYLGIDLEQKAAEKLKEHR
uniref:Carboxylesterase type B domain-containing protein n=1 Tax=Zonotrichia albicollis TaxID=44394 RepID=A0A8D2N4V0_ZONAL